ncbi:hypothetical protein [Streptomyces clavuligerus]|uniref:hypothetical protein n=1 Tax=Streptomyces clavuligerus TaxID=1901 RepID=UPI001F078456|nr:hypothetical protein [Streptomyces clavuligerus]
MFRHDGAPGPRKIEQRLLVERSGPVQGGEFAEAVADRDGRVQSEGVEGAQPGGGAGDDAGLGGLGGHAVAVGGQGRGGVHLVGLGHPAAQGSAAAALARSLSGEEVADAGGAPDPAEEGTAVRAAYSSRPWPRVSREQGEPLFGLVGVRRRRQPLGRARRAVPLEGGGEVAQFGVGDPGGEARQFVEAFAQFPGESASTRRQFRVLGGGRECQAAAGERAAAGAGRLPGPCRGRRGR